MEFYMKEKFSTVVEGHVEIYDDTGKLLLSKKNAIHPANMAIAIARGLSNTPDYQIFKMKLGNSGTVYEGGEIVFRPPRTTQNTLYNATYVEVVDESDSNVGHDNSVTMIVDPGTTTSRVIVTCVISPNEAVDARPTDILDPDLPPVSSDVAGSIDPESKYFFDELGLFTRQTSGDDLDGAGDLMLSHLIFSPIEHTASRELTIIYSLLISVS